MIIDLLLRLLFILPKGGAYKMAIVTVYVTLIIAGRRTYDQVPANLKADVQADLEAQGLGTDGKPLGSE